MPSSVVFRPQAEDEILEARHWYESRNASLGDRFAVEVAALIDRIGENPLIFPRVYGETRRAVLARFPYAIYFRTYDDEIVVVAVHGRQDPVRWQTRS